MVVSGNVAQGTQAHKTASKSGVGYMEFLISRFLQP